MVKLVLINLSFTEGGLLNLPFIFGAPRACAAARFSGLSSDLTFIFFKFFQKIS